MAQVEYKILPSVYHGGGRWQTLFEVLGVHYKKGMADTLEVNVPGWDWDKTCNISAHFLPDELRSRISGIKPNDIFLAEVNLGTTRPRGLKPTHFEPLSKMELLPHIIDVL